MPRRTRQLSLLAALLLTTVSLADDPTVPVKPQNAAENPPMATVGPSTPAILPPEWPFDIRYLLGDDGRPVAIPDKAHLRGYLKWLAREQSKQQAPVAYSVTSIACTGTAEDDLLHLKVAVKIRTTTDDWVLVPLQMAEATLREPPVYEGPGVPPLPAPYDSERGYGWWFKGKEGEKEEHVLTLAVAVPIRKQTPVRRVQLSLPPTAVSSLKLRVPHNRISAKVSEEKSRVSVKSIDGASEIDVIGLGQRMDVSWQLSPDLSSIDTTFEVVTSITATLSEAERTATLFATQTIRSVGQQGIFDQVSVTLPAGGELVQVDSSEYQAHQIDSADATRVVVKLQRPIAGPFDLRWTVRIPLPAAGESFLIDGFDVERARIQSGFLAVAIVGDFRLLQIASNEKEDHRDKSVQQINPDALPAALRQARTSVAYRFENQLRLRLSLRRVDPYVIASPEVWVQIDQEMVRFGATYEFQVLRGSIAEASFRWPGWKAGGWILDKIEASENLGPQLLDEASAADEMRIEFKEPAQKRFRLTIWARRMLEEGALAATFTLPVARTSVPSAARLAALRPQNIELDLQPVDGTILRPQSEASARVVIPRELQKLHRDEYRIESPEAAFRAAITIHPREVTTTSTITASQERPGMTVVRQRVSYNVAYGSLSEVRFIVPPELKLGQMLVSEADGNELTCRVADESMVREVRVALDPPRSGRFELDLQYSSEATIKATAEGEQTLRIPLAVSSDADFTSIQFQWRDAQGRDAVVKGDGWTRLPDPNGHWAWRLPRTAAEVDVVLSQSAGAWNEATVSRALIRAMIGAGGTIQTIAEYRFDGSIVDLSIGFPPNVKLISVWWEGRELKPGVPQIDDKGASRYRIVPDRHTGATALLTIVTSTSGASLSRFSGLSELIAPRLPENLPILECRCQVTLPFGRHLFTEPEGFAPEFRWTRSGVFWSRQSDHTTDELQNWVGTTDRSIGGTFANEGNTYLFSRAGAPTVLRFRVMSLSGIVLVGASLALCLGWILVKWPGTRHVLTLLLCGFAVSVAAVWFPEPVLVLLQPAVLGLLLAAVAAGIDGYDKRRRRPVAVALNSASGYMTPASSVSRGAVLSVGSNEYTSVRLPAADLPSESNESANQLSETGSRS